MTDTTEFEFGYEHACALIYEFGPIEEFERPYPEIDDDQIETMTLSGIVCIDTDKYWKGFNCRVNKDAG